MDVTAIMMQPWLAIGIASIIFAVFLKIVLSSSRSVVKSATVDHKDSKAPPPSKEKTARTKQSVFSSHPRVSATLKGHTDQVLDLSYSQDGELIATVAEDRTIRVFMLATKDHKFQRINIDLTHGVACAFINPRSLAVVLATKRIQVFALDYDVSASKLTYKCTSDFSVEAHKSEILCMGAAPNVIMTCPLQGNIFLWSPTGAQLEDVHTNSLGNNMATLSMDGRFLSVGTFTADVKVWNVAWTKTGSYAGCKKVMNLRGHTSGVFAVCFSADSTKMLTTSKDKTWRLWNIDVRWDANEDPKALLKVPSKIPYTKAALAADASLVALCYGSTLHVYAINWGGAGVEASVSLLESVDHAHEREITALAWLPAGPRLHTLATASGDRRIRLWDFDSR